MNKRLIEFTERERNHKGKGAPIECYRCNKLGLRPITNTPRMPKWRTQQAYYCIFCQTYQLGLKPSQSHMRCDSCKKACTTLILDTDSKASFCMDCYNKYLEVNQWRNKNEYR